MDSVQIHFKHYAQLLPKCHIVILNLAASCVLPSNNKACWDSECYSNSWVIFFFFVLHLRNWQLLPSAFKNFNSPLSAGLNELLYLISALYCIIYPPCLRFSLLLTSNDGLHQTTLDLFHLTRSFFSPFPDLGANTGHLVATTLECLPWLSVSMWFSSPGPHVWSLFYTVTHQTPVCMNRLFFKTKTSEYTRIRRNAATLSKTEIFRPSGGYLETPHCCDTHNIFTLHLQPVVDPAMKKESPTALHSQNRLPKPLHSVEGSMTT